MSKYKILSVGGSIIIPKTGFDINFLKDFRKLILSRVKKGDKFILVIGGGATCRQYQDALAKINKTTAKDLDWLGIYTTWYNAEFVRLMFGNLAFGEVIKNPTLQDSSGQAKKIKTNKPVIVAGGWKPGCSTDKDAVLLAEQFGVKELFNLSNIDYVYDKDPSKYKDAKKIENIDWQSFRKNIVGYKWLPGKNSPFDPIASGLAQKMGLKVGVLNGNNLKEVEKALKDERFKGTIIE